MVNKKIVMIFSVLLLVSFLSISFASAGWFGDFWGKITGKVVTNTPEILILDSNTASWTGPTLWSPQEQSFLDLSFKEIGNCSGKEFSSADVYLYIYDVPSGEEWKRVRYREIQIGENVNFHIDLHDVKGKWISPVIK